MTRSHNIDNDTLYGQGRTEATVNSAPVVDGDHLWEINHSYRAVIGQHQVELVEIAMDETVVAELDKYIHQGVVAEKVTG